MKQLEVRSFGPIKQGSIEFGDLTVLVGPQASGKSLWVQLFKVIQDAAAIRKDLKQYGFDWLRGEDPDAHFRAIYFGGGMQSIWSSATTVSSDGQPVDFHEQIVRSPGKASGTESVFLIPAQRVLVLQDGWPKPFMSYAAGDPYSLRSFSDTLRKLMEAGLGGGEAIFPQPGRFNVEMRRLVDEGIYVSGQLKLHSDGMRKQIVLFPHGRGLPLPYSAWSAGQREFTPLLLGLYWLIPSARISMRDSIKTVIIEEPEMGLHPQAIVTVCLLVLELLHRNYRVVLSTHSPVVLDIVWMIRELKSLDERVASTAMREVFGVRRPGQTMRAVLASALKKSFRTYYFDRVDGSVCIRDISSLDPDSEDANISGWGGLSGFSGRIADIVGNTFPQGA